MLIDARNVTKAFGAFKAVDDASVTVEEGDILGLIGPNGAGKSTFFNCLTGDLPVTSGTVSFAGADVTRLPPEARAKLGLARTFQVPLTFESMSVLDNATIGALLRHPNARDARARARDVLQRVGLGHLTDAPAKSLGTPGRKRLEIARALASEPKALLLDEAMAGLTPTEVREAIELVRRIHGGGITIVIVEHIMEVIVSLAQRVVVFHQGREIARGTPREVTSNQRSSRPISAAARCGTRSAPVTALLSVEPSRGALRRPHRRGRCLARGAGGLGGGAARLQRRGQDDDAQRHRRHRHGLEGHDRVRRREHRGPARLCHRAQGTGAVARGLAAVHAAERREQPAAGRHAARRPQAHPAPARARLRGVPAACRAAHGRRRAPCRAASARCWRSAAR